MSLLQKCTHITDIRCKLSGLHPAPLDVYKRQAAVLCHFLGANGVWHAFWITEVLSAIVALSLIHI